MQEYSPVNLDLLMNSYDPAVWAEEFVRVTTVNEIDPRNTLLMTCWIMSAMEMGRRDVLEKIFKGEIKL